MGAEEKSIKIYDTRQNFFAKIGSTVSRILTPTKVGFNNLLINIKRNSAIKYYKNMLNCKEEKREAIEKKFEDYYSLYLEAIDQLLVETIYKKVTLDTASDFEKDALSKYYNVIHLKETDETEYKYKKQQYLLNLDYNSIKESNKTKQIEEYSKLYLYEMEQLYKGLLKHYSIKLPEQRTPADKENMYNKIFDTLEEYVNDIVPLKEIEDDELIKECSLFETYEVGKLDQVDMLDKRMILLGISRKLFVHSLPLMVARKRENAYQLLLRLIDEYNKKLLSVKIYWNNNEDKANYNIFANKCKELEKIRESKGAHEYDIRKQILYIREDMRFLTKYNDKYYRIMKFYKGRLVKLGDMKQIKSFKTGNYKVVKGLKREILNETAC